MHGMTKGQRRCLACWSGGKVEGGSVLGKEGIDRQVRAAVHDVIEKHQARIEQQQQRVQRQDQPLQPRRAAKI